ncbi:hypothetical protein ACWKWC_02635 [Geodermatophilus nigrescens]
MSSDFSELRPKGTFVVPVTTGPRGVVIEWVSFRPGEDGWAVYRSQQFDAEGSWLFLRFGLDRGIDTEQATVDGRPAAVARANDELPQAFIEVREVLVSFKGGGVAARVLRDIPLTRIEAAVNQPDYRAKLLHRLPGPDVSQRPFEWDSPRDSGWWFAHPHPYASPKITVEVPEGRGRPDEFYEAVARAYGYLNAVSTRPASEMAEANDVPVSTIHGWVKEARRRGFLPAGERSKGRGQ